MEESFRKLIIERFPNCNIMEMWKVAELMNYKATKCQILVSQSNRDIRDSSCICTFKSFHNVREISSGNSLLNAQFIICKTCHIKRIKTRHLERCPCGLIILYHINIKHITHKDPPAEYNHRTQNINLTLLSLNTKMIKNNHNRHNIFEVSKTELAHNDHSLLPFQNS